jgi:hypothetical protein
VGELPTYSSTYSLLAALRPLPSFGGAGVGRGAGVGASHWVGDFALKKIKN